MNDRQKTKATNYFSFTSAYTNTFAAVLSLFISNAFIFAFEWSALLVLSKHNNCK